MKTTTLTLQQISIPLPSFLTDLLKKISQNTLYQTGINNIPKFSTAPSFSSSRLGMNNFKKNFKKNYVLLIPLIIFGGLLIYMVGSFFAKDSNMGVQGISDQRVDVKKPLAVRELNKSYTFTVPDVNGKPTKVKFFLENAELRDQIIVKGRSAVSVTGRLFFIVNLKVTNDTNTAVALDTRNYVRVITKGSNEKLAPDIHNDPVQVQAISTKLSRLGLPIDDTDKELTLQIGEIEGKKEQVQIRF